MFKTFYGFMYELAMMTLPRVTFSEVPGIQGVVIDRTEVFDEQAERVLVHWGRMDKRTVQTWHPAEELTFL